MCVVRVCGSVWTVCGAGVWMAPLRTVLYFLLHGRAKNTVTATCVQHQRIAVAIAVLLQEAGASGRSPDPATVKFCVFSGLAFLSVRGMTFEKKSSLAT